MRKVTDRSTHWTEPKRVGGPDMTATAVAEEIGFRDVESVHTLVRRGPYNDGLAGYIPKPSGRGWTMKESTGHSGVEVMFYSEDIDEWKERHPVVERQKERVEYSEEEKNIVLAEAEAIKSNGTVNRKRLMDVLAEKYGIKYWNTRTYKKMKQILDDAEITSPYPLQGAEIRRKYKTDNT